MDGAFAHRLVRSGHANCRDVAALPQPSGSQLPRTRNHGGCSIVMPVLAWGKRNVAKASNNRALAADAVQSATCGYLAGLTIAGLGINAFFHIHWVDSVAALAAIPVLVIEGRRAIRDEACGRC